MNNMQAADSRKIDFFENTPISKALIKLALPTALGQIVLVIYNIADTFYIGLTNSNINTTGVTICMPVFMILTSIANLFGIGAASTISRALGKLSYQRAKDTCAFSFWFCLFSSLLYCLVVFICLDPIVDFIGGKDPSVHVLAREYIIITVILAGTFTSLGSFSSHIIRTEGKAVVASIGVIGAGILNILLDPLFMFGILPPGREVYGAAVATALSNIIGFLFFCLYFIKNRKKSQVLSVKLRPECFKNKIPHFVFDAGIPAAIMTLCENVSYAVLDNLMAYAGTAALAGIGVAKKINMLAHSTVRGISQGALPLLGYNYSAGKRKDTKKTIRITVSISVSIALICFALSFIFARNLIHLFIRESPEGVNYGSRFLIILGIGAPFSACAYTFISFFQAVGHGKLSLLLALLRKGIVDIPLMIILNMIIPVYGIVFATPLADIICCVAALLCFVSFAAKHLKHNKARKFYNTETGKLEIIDKNQAR